MRSLHRNGADQKGFGISQQAFCNAKFAFVRTNALLAGWIRCSFSGSMLAVASSKYFLRQQERNLLQGSALIAAVTQVMKMKEIYLSKLPMDCYGDGEPQQTHQTGFGRSKKDLGEMHCHRLMATPRITNRTDRQMQLTPFLRSVKASKEH